MSPQIFDFWGFAALNPSHTWVGIGFDTALITGFLRDRSLWRWAGVRVHLRWFGEFRLPRWLLHASGQLERANAHSRLQQLDHVVRVDESVEIRRGFLREDTRREPENNRLQKGSRRSSTENPGSSILDSWASTVGSARISCTLENKRAIG